MIRWLHAWFLYGVLVRVSFACVCCVVDPLIPKFSAAGRDASGS